VQTVRSYLANVLLALEMLCRKDQLNGRQQQIARAGLASARSLAQLLLVRPDQPERPSPRPT